MIDKSLSIFLMVLFGISGTAVLALAWLSTMSGTERIMATFAGSFGLAIALTQTPALKSSPVTTDKENLPEKTREE